MSTREVIDAWAQPVFCGAPGRTCRRWSGKNLEPHSFSTGNCRLPRSVVAMDAAGNAQRVFRLAAPATVGVQGASTKLTKEPA